MLIFPIAGLVSPIPWMLLLGWSNAINILHLEPVAVVSQDENQGSVNGSKAGCHWVENLNKSIRDIAIKSNLSLPFSS